MNAMIVAMRVMRSVACALALALFASPAVLDACLVSCQRVVTHETMPVAPTCHQHVAAGAPARLSTPAVPCGHDHGRHDATVSSRVAQPDGIRDSGFGICRIAKTVDQIVVGRALTRVASHEFRVPRSTPTPLRI